MWGFSALRTGMAASLALVLLGPIAAAAGDKPASQEISATPEDVAGKLDAEGKDEAARGWAHSLRLGGTFAFSHSDNVVGSTDGSNVQLGVVLEGSASWTRARSTWENVLKLQHTRSRTPVIDAFIKSLDNLDLQSTYYLRLKRPEWIGPFVRARLQTQVFEGFEIRASETEVLRLFLDGTETLQTVPAETQIELTGSFEPLILSQNAGLFATPPGSDALNVKARLGVGAQEILAGDEAFAVKDDEATPELELVQLEDVVQGGGVLDVNLAGKLAENVVWKLDSNLFLELFSDSDVDVSALNLDVNGSVSVKIARWASLDYVLLVRRVPHVLDDWQVSNGLVLTTGFDLF